MIYLQSQVDKRNKYIKFFIVILILIGIVVAAVFITHNKKTEPNEDGYVDLYFDTAKMELSEYQENKDIPGILLKVSPAKIKTGKHAKIVVTLNNDGSYDRAWGDREDNIVMERFEKGKWYTSGSCAPKLTHQEIERYFLSGDSVIQYFKLSEAMEPGEYRFTALFKNGLVVGRLTITF